MTIHSLYIHLPWCLRKCPYCDFNSYPAEKNSIPEESYIQQLIANLRKLGKIWDIGPLATIYIGGGTPSLFSPSSIQRLLEETHRMVGIDAQAEISMEINPGTVNAQQLRELSRCINRISFGVQSFNDKCLRSIQRIHSAAQAKNAIYMAQDAGISNINLDLMHGLPEQGIHEALSDLNTALELKVPHISWYELTLEEGTTFGNNPPENLPDQELCERIEETGLEFLKNSGFLRYEISAFTCNQSFCRHNLTYWNYLDYAGIGAGAHSKYTDHKNGRIMRLFQEENPQDFLKDNLFTDHLRIVPDQELPFEYLLNTTRLYRHFISFQDFYLKTRLNPDILMPQLKAADACGFIELEEEGFQLTQFGHYFTNHFLEMFLPF